METILIDHYGCYITGITNLAGEIVKRTKWEYPYSYDPFLTWKNNFIKNKSNAVYSDRLMQWDFKKFNKCCKKVWGNEGQYFYNREPEDIEKFLNLYWSKEIKLTTIEEGCNVSSGYPIWIFYYEDNN